MKRNNVIQLALLIPVIGIFISCSGKNHFTVKGTVKGGNEKMLYLENITTSKVVLLDSAKLGNSGAYKFKYARPVAPDFYRLRLENQLINFVIDSAETVTINSDTLQFAQNYTVEGSPESERVKTLTLLQLKTSETYNQLQDQYRSQSITADEYKDKTSACIEGYKNEAKKYIYPNPASASAYFALFQQINGLLIYDPYDRTDSKAYGAVANNWNIKYPNAPRAKQLVQLFTNALAVLREQQPDSLNMKTIESKDFFDITLLSVDGKAYRLSDVGKDKVVVLDFTAYGMQDSPVHNQLLAKVYEKYSSRGFQIYQISLDADEHFWKNAAVNLPWVCVMDPQSVNSEIARKYNVRDIPTAFILNRKGEIVKRIDDYTKLEADVLTYLK